MAENQLSKSSNAPFVVPHDVFDAMRREMNNIFGTLDLRPQEWPALLASIEGRAIAPQLDVRETDKAFVIEAELPGVDDKDVSVTFTNGVLSVRGGEEIRARTKGPELLRKRAFLRAIRACYPFARQRGCVQDRGAYRQGRAPDYGG